MFLLAKDEWLSLKTSQSCKIGTPESYKPLHRSVTQTGRLGLYFMSHVKQHAHHQLNLRLCSNYICPSAHSAAFWYLKTTCDPAASLGLVSALLVDLSWESAAASCSSISVWSVPTWTQLWGTRSLSSSFVISLVFKAGCFSTVLQHVESLQTRHRLLIFLFQCCKADRYMNL